MKYIPAKTLIYKTGGSEMADWVDYSMNIYRGCSHGCIYCDSRSLCFKNPDFDTVMAKENALAIIRDDLRRKVKKGVIATGAMSDPYNPFEQELKLTRHALELINAFGHGVSIVTKSDMVMRDLDILQDIKQNAPVSVNFSITTADDELCKIIEPHTANTSKRLEALAHLAGGGIFCGVYINPVLPFITDNPENILKIVRMAKQAGASFVHTYMSMTLRPGSREYYYKQLDAHLPGIKDKYIKKYGYSKYCPPANAKQLWVQFVSECNKLGLMHDMRTIVRKNRAHYKPDQQLKFI